MTKCKKHNWVMVQSFHLFNNPVGEKIDEFYFVCPDCNGYKKVIVPLKENGEWNTK